MQEPKTCLSLFLGIIVNFFGTTTTEMKYQLEYKKNKLRILNSNFDFIIFYVYYHKEIPGELEAYKSLIEKLPNDILPKEKYDIKYIPMIVDSKGREVTHDISMGKKTFLSSYIANMIYKEVISFEKNYQRPLGIPYYLDCTKQNIMDMSLIVYPNGTPIFGNVRSVHTSRFEN